MRRLANIAVTLLLAGAAPSLVGVSAALAVFSVRQAARAAPFPLHPWGAAAGLFALPLGLLCWRAARHRLGRFEADQFAAWRLREL